MVYTTLRLLNFGSNVVEGGARTQPLELVARHCVSRRNLEGLARALRHAYGYVRPLLAIKEVLQADSLDDVARVDPGVVGLVDEPQRENALLFEVRFVDTSERSSNNYSATLMQIMQLEACRR